MTPIQSLPVIPNYDDNNEYKQLLAEHYANYLFAFTQSLHVKSNQWDFGDIMS